MRVLRAVVLTIALAMAAASAGAQGVLEQLRARSVPEPPCRRFETALEMRNAGDWNVLDVVPHDMSARAKIVEEDLQMRGGIRLVLEVDTAALRNDMMEKVREEIRRIVRAARLGSPSAVVIRGNTIEFRPRAGIDAEVVSKALSVLTSGQAPLLISRAPDADRAAGGVVAFAVSDRAIEERRISSRQIVVERLGRSIGGWGIGPTLAQELGSDRILVVVPGLKRADRFSPHWQMTTRLEFRMAERFADPCVSRSPDAEVLRSWPTNVSAVVWKHVIASGDNLAGAVAVRDTRTGSPAVAFRLDRGGSDRLARVTQDKIEQSLAIVLDNKIIAMPTIREPIAGGAVLVSGGLTVEQAWDLAVLIRAGSPFPRLTVVEQQVVEPKPQ